MNCPKKFKIGRRARVKAREDCSVSYGTCHEEVVTITSNDFKCNDCPGKPDAVKANLPGDDLPIIFHIEDLELL